MKLLVLSLILLSLLLLHPVSAESISEISISLQGNGGIIANSDRSWEASNMDLGFYTGGVSYNSGTASSHTLTGPGSTFYSENTITDNTVSNRFDTSKYLVYEGNGESWDNYHMTDIKQNISAFDCTTGVIVAGSNNIEDAGTEQDDSIIVAGQEPSHQEVNVRSEIAGDSTHYEVDVVSDDADLTTSVRAEGNGSFVSSIRTKAEAGFDVDSAMLNFVKNEHIILGSFSNKTGKYGGSIDFKWKDHSTPFEFTNITFSSPYST